MSIMSFSFFYIFFIFLFPFSSYYFSIFFSFPFPSLLIIYSSHFIHSPPIPTGQHHPRLRQSPAPSPVAAILLAVELPPSSTTRAPPRRSPRSAPPGRWPSGPRHSAPLESRQGAARAGADELLLLLKLLPLLGRCPARRPCRLELVPDGRICAAPDLELVNRAPPPPRSPLPRRATRRPPPRHTTAPAISPVRRAPTGPSAELR
jgi:hypothetical protein